MAISGILVPLDGAGITASVLPTVASIARPIRAAVHLVAIVDLGKREIPTHYYAANPDARSEPDPDVPESAPLVPGDAGPGRDEALRRTERARVYLGALASRLQALRIESSYEAFAGDPMTDIVQLARRKRFGMIAMSPHSRYAIGRGLGSVTDRVLHTSSIPILVAPPPEDPALAATGLSIRTVIVGLDGSHASEFALEPAVQVSRACDAELILLRAIGGRAAERAWYEGAERVGRNIQSDFRTSALQYLAKTAKAIEVPSTTVVGAEDEVTEILNMADRKPSALIVLASQGQSGLTKWRLGSVTDRIVRQTKHPTIIVPSIMAGRR